MKFIVIGGGICGLTTAIALIRSGHEVGVFEVASELREAGAGVVLGANAMRALHALGIHDAVKAAGSEISTMSVCEANGAAISEMDTLKFTQTSGFRNIAIHRADLQRILLEHLPEGRVQLSSPFERFEQNGEQVTAYFAGDIAATTDGLLAADGIRSRARLQVFPKSLRASPDIPAGAESRGLPHSGFRQDVLSSSGVGPIVSAMFRLLPVRCTGMPAPTARSRIIRRFRNGGLPICSVNLPSLPLQFLNCFPERRTICCFGTTSWTSSPSSASLMAAYFFLETLHMQLRLTSDKEPGRRWKTPRCYRSAFI